MSALDFRRVAGKSTRPGPRPSRLAFYLILAMGVVVILADWARRPQSWRWLDRMSSSVDETAAADIDNRLSAALPSEAPPDGFVIPRDPPPADRDVDVFQGVEAARLKAIRDDAVPTRAETACMLGIFAALEKQDDPPPRQESSARTSYAQLYRQPDEYRGREVTVVGTVRRVNRLTMPKNDFGLPAHFYQVWLRLDDNRSAPLAACCLHLPPGFPLGLDVSEEAEVTGVFFKRWPYEAGDGLRSAPTLLAKTLQWRRPPPPVEQPPVDAVPIAYVVLAAVGLTLLTTLWIYWRTKPPRPMLPAAPPDFSALENPERENGTADEK